MSDPKDNSQGFFRKVVKFVANPATDWSNLGTPAVESRDSDLAKSELKAMVERKRRNDFVRKREFDMLRKVRREGLTSEQMAALGGSSRLDDSEGRLADGMARSEGGVKAKIDEIEQQMVGDPMYAHRRSLDVHNAPTMPAAMPHTPTAGGALPPMVPPAGTGATRPGERAALDLPLREQTAPLPLGVDGTAFAQAFTVEAGDLVHDPELDDAVISFANADFEPCERMLVSLTGPGGARMQHAETWLVLFDFYRATGRQQKFENVALHYAQQFGWSAPQWYSLPQQVAEAAAGERPVRPPVDGQVGWVCPPLLDAEAVARLAVQTQHMPLPWVFDWSGLEQVEAAACMRLGVLFGHWIDQSLDMRWLAGDHFLDVLRTATPTGVREVDPAVWRLRLDALRMAYRPVGFDEAAMDYCITYEVSPPSWRPARSKVRIGATGSDLDRPTQLSSMVGEVTSDFLESQPYEEPGDAGTPAAGAELSGEFVGDIGATLAQLDERVAGSSRIIISCARLIRVDFLAAGDLLNWVLARRAENRSVVFADAHRLVALFFGAMGINEHARIKVRPA